MKWKRGVILLSLVFLILVNVNYIDSSSEYGVYAFLEWHDIQVKSIAPNARLKVDFVIQLSGDFKECKKEGGSKSCKVMVDLSDMNNEGKTELETINLEDCIKNESIYRCKKEGVLLKTTDNTISLPKTRIMIGSLKALEKDITIPLILDNTRPKLVSIETEYCENEVCYIAPGIETTITSVFEDEISSFDFRLVWMGTEGEGKEPLKSRASECEGLTCKTNIVVPCVDGQELRLNLYSAGPISSMEDAQNKIEYGEPIQLFCDGKAPQILNFEMKSSAPGGVVITNLDTINIEVEVIEKLSGVKLYINSSNISNEEIIEGECQSISKEKYLCSGSFSNLIPGEGKLEIYIEDGVGNFVKIEKKIIINKAAEGNIKPDFFKVKVVGITPNKVNRVALDLSSQQGIEWPIFLTYSIEKKSRENTKVVYTEIEEKKCETKNTTGGWEKRSPIDKAEIINPYQEDSKNSIIRFALYEEKERAWINKTEIKCPMKIYVKKGDLFYHTPEEENISFTLEFFNTPFGTPGEEFEKEIKRYSEKIDSGQYKLMRNLERVMATLDTGCAMIESIYLVKSAGNFIEGVGHVFTAVGGQVIARKGASIDQMMLLTLLPNVLLPAKDDVEGKAVGGERGGLRKFCDYVSCRLSAWKKEESFGKSEDKGIADKFKIKDPKGKISEYLNEYVLKDLDAPNAEESLISSILSGCVKGIIHNLYKWVAIDCGYVKCLKEQAETGSGIHICKKAKGFKVCTTVLGEIFNLPYINVITNLASRINAVIKEFPTFALDIFFYKRCEDRLKDVSFIGFGCRLWVTYTGITEFKSLRERYADFSYPSTDICLEALCDPDTKKECKVSTSYLNEYLGSVEMIKSKTHRSHKKNMMQNELITYAKKCSENNNDDCKNEANRLSEEYNIDKNDLEDETTMKNILEADVQGGEIYVGENNEIIVNIPATKDGEKNEETTLEQAIKYKKCQEGAYKNLDVCKNVPEQKPKECGNDDPDCSKFIEMKRKEIKQKYWSQILEILAEMIVMYLKEKGYLEVLSLTGWGDWGRSIVSTTQQVLDPHQWANSFCNEINAIDTDTDVFYETKYSTQFGLPAITFAGEKRLVKEPQKTSTNIYIISYIVTSPQIAVGEKAYKLRFKVKPDTKYINITNGQIIEKEEEASWIELYPESPLEGGLAFNSTLSFEEICIEFNNKFPNLINGRKEYCREFVESAYKR